MKLEFSGSSYLIHTNIMTEFYENLRWCMWDPWTTCHGMTQLPNQKLKINTRGDLMLDLLIVYWCMSVLYGCMSEVALRTFHPGQYLSPFLRLKSNLFSIYLQSMINQLLLKISIFAILCYLLQYNISINS